MKGSFIPHGWTTPRVTLKSMAGSGHHPEAEAELFLPSGDVQIAIEKMAIKIVRFSMNNMVIFRG